MLLVVAYCRQVPNEPLIREKVRSDLPVKVFPRSTQKYGLARGGGGDCVAGSILIWDFLEHV